MQKIYAALRGLLSEKVLVLSWRIAPKEHESTRILTKHLRAYFVEVLNRDAP